MQHHEELWTSKNGKWKILNQKDGLIDDYTLSVKQVGDTMWVGTLSGLSIYDGETFTNFSAQNGLGGNEIHDIVVHDGRVYVGTDAGITVFDAGELK